MNDAAVSGTFAIIGTALGWILSEAGAGWRGYSERKRAARAATEARVFDAAFAAVAVAEGCRALIDIDVARASHGEHISHQTYEEIVTELLGQLRALRQAPLAFAAHGPRDALPSLEAMIDVAQALWHAFEATPRSAIADSPQPLRDMCDALASRARTLAGQEKGTSR